jgi:glycosyltransferase involved in cell wall biosynthesis
VVTPRPESLSLVQDQNVGESLTLETSGPFEVALLVGPANWYEVRPLAAACEEAQIRLLLLTKDAAGRCPLAELPLDEIRFVCLALGEERKHFAGATPCASISLGAYDRFLEECRAIHHGRTARALLDGPAEAAGSAELRLPPITHVVFRDESAMIVLLRMLGRIVDSPTVGAWIHEIVSASDFAEQARDRFSLRWLALWGEAVFHDPVARRTLRAIYGDETSRDRLLREDQAETTRLGLESSVTVWARHLGLDRVTARERPFPAPIILPRSTSTGTPDVTILIPSYKHEAYVELAIGSVLAQTYPHFRILVADDCSPDATVENVKKVADDRVEIIIRPRNVGLGNNVVEALARIDTPYVAILNSDDFFHPERLERCRRALEERPDAVIAATGIVLVDAHGNSLTRDSTIPLLDGPEIAGWVSWYYEALQTATRAHSFVGPLLRHNFLATSSNLFARTSFLRRRAAVLRDLKYCLDWQIFLDAAIEDALVYLPEELVAYRLHTDNTVWFREGGRWSYLLEVNRVVARGLRRLLDRIGHEQRSEEALARMLEMLVEHVADNTEIDGLTLFLHEFLHESDFDGAAVRSSRVRALLEKLGRRAEERRQATYLQRAIGDDAASLISLRNMAPYLRLLRNAGEVSEDTAANLAMEKGELLSRINELQSQVAFLRADLEGAKLVNQELELVKPELERERDFLYSQIHDLEGQKDSLTKEREALQAALALEQTARTVEKRRHREEIDRLYAFREWRIGNFLWNRLGLAKVARPAGQQWRRLRDRKNRGALALTRALRWPPTARYRAVVAASWHFPLYFNTFVYQEMQALREVGFAVKVFCWQTNPRRDLHPAFRDLWRNRVVLQVDWSRHHQDVAHFRRTRPRRVASFLERLVAETGLTEETLLQDATVLMGFTFARHVELVGADYLHSYFFYDQSFMVMMAAYLLDIPRGITAYADHMLTDYPLKCVRLHVELADIVVATSRRIRDELGAIGGDQFVNKILIKPNGIDVSRFPYCESTRRFIAGGDLELIAVNRIEPKKGLLYLAEAVRILADRGVGVRLHLVGSVDPYAATSAEYAEELAAKIQELGIADRVVMHGVKKQPEIVTLLARSCIFVAPYVEVASGDKDGIPTAMLEAMSTGLPIVTTDAGSIPEAVTSGVEAICVPQRDPVRLAEAIQRLVRDPALRARMGEAGRRRVETEYSVDVTERPLHERIKALLDRPKG